MNPIHVLVVSESVDVRRALCRLLASDPEIEASSAALVNGLALGKFERLRPDAVVLGGAMSPAACAEDLCALRTRAGRVPVLAWVGDDSGAGSAAVASRAAAASSELAAPLERGSSVGSGALVSEVKRRLGRAEERPASGCLHEVGRAVDLIAIGVSTGGPRALARLLTDLPDSLPPIVIVQHMPPRFTAELSRSLDRLSRVEVREGRPGAQIVPGTAWVAPAPHHMLVAREGARLSIELDDGPPVNHCRPAVDVLFRSVAEVCAAGSLAVVLTGMGKDGLAGCHAIRDQGGAVFAQDEATSTVWGMPGAVARAGLANAILPLDQVGGAIVRAAARSGARQEASIDA